MEGPLLTKSENIVDTTIIGDSSSNDEHNVDITISGDYSSIDEQTPHEAEGVECCYPCTRESVWGLIEFVLTLVQIVAAIVVLTRAKDEHPETEFLVWIISYTCGCIAKLYVLYIVRIDEDDFFETMLDFLFVRWVVLFLLIYLISSSSLYDNTQYFWLCMAFLAFSCIRYVLFNLLYALICLIFATVICLTAHADGVSHTMMILCAFGVSMVGFVNVFV